MKEKDLRGKFKELVANSNLNDDQKKLWEFFILKADQNEVEAVFEAAEEEEENIILLTNHLRDKILEIEKDNRQDWEGVADNEEGYAEALAEK